MMHKHNITAPDFLDAPWSCSIYARRKNLEAMYYFINQAHPPTFFLYGLLGQGVSLALGQLCRELIEHHQHCQPVIRAELHRQFAAMPRRSPTFAKFAQHRQRRWAHRGDPDKRAHGAGGLADGLQWRRLSLRVLGRTAGILLLASTGNYRSHQHQARPWTTLTVDRLHV
jgi:hypothetical protein